MKAPPVPSMDGKTVVVTGGNSGIGKATATALASAGARVVLCARSERKGHEAVSDIRSATGNLDVDVVVFDLADLASVRGGAADILDRCDRIDVLVNNAGLVLTEREETIDGFEATFAINHLAPFLLTLLLAQRLVDSAPARVVTVASIAHRSVRRGLDVHHLNGGGRYRGMKAYSRSKLANILFTTELARRLEGTGVTANCLHPGTVSTGYGRDGDTHGFLTFGLKVIHPFILNPEEGARTSVYLASSPDVAEVTGGYFVKCRPKIPSTAARDAAAAHRLWKASEDLVGERWTEPDTVRVPPPTDP